MSIYDKNKVLFLPFTTKKVGLDVPPLTPYNCNILNCCASYIKEEYENWDLKVPIIEEVKKEIIMNYMILKQSMMVH